MHVQYTTLPAAAMDEADTQTRTHMHTHFYLEVEESKD